MSKSISYSNHNISTTQDHSNNALSTFFNTSKIYKKEDNNQTHYKKLKMISLNSTPNTLNNKNLNSFCCATINNTFSNERKENKKNTIPMSSRLDSFGAAGLYSFQQYGKGQRTFLIYQKSCQPCVCHRTVITDFSGTRFGADPKMPVKIAVAECRIFHHFPQSIGGSSLATFT